MVRLGKAATVAAIALLALAYAALAGEDISVHEAFERAGNGEILLVDIRSPGEWRETGIATVAKPISMHEDGFFEKLDAALQGDHSRPLALICARGGRSLYMQAQLIGRGYTNVINVPAGMMGGRNGPGWISSGLPVKPYDG